MLQDWVQLARYGHLPVGNLGGDWLLDIADAHYARCLRDAGHLLWITDPGIPDVASRGDDDAAQDLLLSADPAPLEVTLRPVIGASRVHMALSDKRTLAEVGQSPVYCLLAGLMHTASGGA